MHVKNNEQNLLTTTIVRHFSYFCFRFM